MAWSTDTIERFEKITKFDYTQFLTDFYNFNENKKPLIYSYYEGNSEIDGSAFDELNRLIKVSKQASLELKLNSESFTQYDDWELFEEIETINNKLNTIFNSSKYLRSSISTGNFNPNPLVEVTLSNNQTLERLAQNVNSDDPQNDWTSLFLQNQLTEEDYTSEGGVLLKVTFQGSDPLVINSVVDNIDTADKTYGKDIKSRLTFASDDLETLTYKETLLQSLKILTSLKRGDNPEFSSDGIDRSVVIGNTYGAVAFPIIFRQIYQNFTTDDTFKSFAITDASFSEGTLILTYEVRTRSDEVQSGTISL